MRQLKLPHRLVMLDHGHPEKKMLVKKARMQNIVTFAALAEAYMMGKIDVQDGDLVLRDDTATAFPVINHVVDAIGSNQALKSLPEWIEELSVQVPFYVHVRDNLVENELLEKEERKILGIRYSVKYYPAGQELITDFMAYLQERADSPGADLRDKLTLIFLRTTTLGNISFVNSNSEKLLKAEEESAESIFIHTAARL